MSSTWSRVAVLAAAGLAAALLVYFFFEPLQRLWYLLWDVTAHKKKLRNFVWSFGPFAPLAFVGLQFLQVVISPFPGELTGLVGGYLFGVYVGTILSTVGLTLGSWACFFLGRSLGRPFVEWLVTRAVVDRFGFLLSPRGTFLVFLCYLIPGFPKDYLSYLLGLSHMRASTFLWISALGRLPGTVLLSLQGAKVYEGQFRGALAITGAALFLVAVLAYFREPIRAWMHRRSGQS